MQNNKLGLHSEIVFALLARGVQGATMLAAALCVAWRLSVEEQGLFFVFMSLGALLQLSDFGISYAALQTASHFRFADQAGRLGAFRNQANRINRLVLSAATIIVGALGALIVSGRPDAGQVAIGWAGPWIAFIIAVFVSQLVNLEVVLVEGGRSATVAWRFRLLQEALGGSVFIAALVGGAGLWSLCAYWSVRPALAALWLRQVGDHTRPPAESVPAHFNWRQEVWPFQWRIGLSGLSGFLIFQSFNPIVLIEQGTSVAGRFGMSLAMMNMMLLVTTVWPLSQVSRYVGLIAERKFEETQRAFWRMLAGSTALAALLAAGSLVALWWMDEKGVSFVGRLADLTTTGTLFCAAVVHHVVNCFAVFLRAERREPLLTASVLGGLVTVVAVWLSARYGAPRDIALANLGCALVGIPIVLIYYRRLTAAMLANEADGLSRPT
ncbi:MAG: hypothetical protein ABI724_02780 [Betaproteobacteria bacterium]